MAGLLLSAGTISAQEDEECFPIEAAALLDPNGDGFISIGELEEFVVLLRTIDPAAYPGDLEADIAEVETFIVWLYENDMTGVTYVVCEVPDPTVPPEVTPEPTTPPVVTPEPTVPPEVTPEPTTPPYVEPQPTVAPPPEETLPEPEVVEPAAPVVEEAAPVVAQTQPAVVTLPNTGTGTGEHSVSTPAVVLFVASGGLGLLGMTLRVRRAIH